MTHSSASQEQTPENEDVSVDVIALDLLRVFLAHRVFVGLHMTFVGASTVGYHNA
jgi:hypothetical protein